MILHFLLDFLYDRLWNLGVLASAHSRLDNMALTAGEFSFLRNVRHVILVLDIWT